MFGFSLKMFIGLLGTCTIGNFSKSLVSNLKRPIKCVSLNNQSCKARPTLNSDENPFTVNVIKYGGSCNSIVDPYA